MRFEIDTEKTVRKPESTLRLSLEQDSDGNVSLVGVDEDGALWYIMTLMGNGTIRLEPSVSSDGIQVDNCGRIRVAN